MELYQLKYLRAVVTKGGVHQAARYLHVSAPAISKAISNLENELGCLIFDRTNRTLVLSEIGTRLFRRADQILNLEEATLAEIKGPATIREITIAGREIFLSHFGVRMRQLITKRFSEASVTFIESSGVEAISLVDRGLAHLAFTTQKPPAAWFNIHVTDFECVLCMGKSHPLLRTHKKSGKLSIGEVLKYDFVTPTSILLSGGESFLSGDGWPDELFPRKISSRAESLYLYRELLSSTNGIGFLPKFWVEANGLHSITVKDGPQLTLFPVYCSAKLAKDLSWLGNLMLDFSK